MHVTSSSLLLLLAVYTIVVLLIFVKNIREMRSNHACADISPTITSILSAAVRAHPNNTQAAVQSLLKTLRTVDNNRALSLYIFEKDGAILHDSSSEPEIEKQKHVWSIIQKQTSPTSLLMHAANGTYICHLAFETLDDGTVICVESK